MSYKTADTGLLLINVLPADMYADCHIPGSISVPIQELKEYAKTTILAKDRPIIVYCAHVHCPLSGQARDVLRKLGYRNVRAYEGGMQEWYRRGLPTRGNCQMPYLTEEIEPLPGNPVLEDVILVDQLYPIVQLHTMYTKRSPYNTAGYMLRDFMPLLSVVSVIILLIISRALLQPPATIHTIMLDSMGFFFFIFGLFKLYSLRDFAIAFSEYDVIAGVVKPYGYIYPFIEIVFGILYLLRINEPWLHASVCVVMLVSALGVARALLRREQLMCACLGTVFRIPMTYVTLGEDVLMFVMALIMLLGWI